MLMVAASGSVLSRGWHEDTQENIHHNARIGCDTMINTTAYGSNMREEAAVGGRRHSFHHWLQEVMGVPAVSFHGIT